jgi:hypothetical protein
VRSTSSELRITAEPRWYSCHEPWTGIFSVETNQDVTFCPCYLQMRIGNLAEASMHEIWNSPALVGLRESFRRGELPDVCAGQLCPVVLGEE